MHLWEIEQRSHAIFNGVFIGTINRVGKEEEFGPNDYYGTSYFCDPRGQYVPDILTSQPKASDTEEQLIVADLNLDLVQEVRNTGSSIGMAAGYAGDTGCIGFTSGNRSPPATTMPC
jgi:N-carbamoylputrescine amidase